MCVVKLHDLQNPAIAPPPPVQTKNQTASLLVMLVIAFCMANMTDNMAAPDGLSDNTRACVAMTT
jgi:hypothetical protein